MRFSWTRPLSLSFVAIACAAGVRALVGCAAGNGDELQSGPAASAGATTSAESTSQSGSGVSGSSGPSGSSSNTTGASTGSGSSTSGGGGMGGMGGASSSSSSSGSGGAGGAPGPGTLVLVAGGAQILAGEYGANGWVTTNLADATNDGPAVTCTSGKSAVALIRSTSNAGELRFSTWTPGSWSLFAQVKAKVTTKSTPALASNGGAADSLFLGDNNLHYWGIYLNGWSPADGSVKDNANVQAFGPSPGTVTVIGGLDVIAYAGNDHDLYDQTRTGMTWSSGNGHKLGDFTTITPTIAALNGGTADAMIVVVKNDGTIVWTVRTNNSWSVPLDISANDPNAITQNPVALAPLPKGEAVIAWRKSNGALFFSRYTPGKLMPWSSPTAAFNPNFTIPSSPALAPGIQGAEAELAFVDQATGKAMHARLSANAFAAPVVVGGSGQTTIAIASSP